MSIRRNAVANFAGQSIRALTNFAFIPLYIELLGVEAYGLVGLLGALQAWLGLLDMGMRPALAREAARLSADAVTPFEFRTLLRTIETLLAGLAFIVFALIFACSSWLAAHWIGETTLSPQTVSRALAIMGGITAVRFLEATYTGIISGLQRQLLENMVTASLSVIRAVGAIGILVWVDASIEAFFAWQLALSLGSTAVFALVARRVLPPTDRPVRFSKHALKSVSGFATGMTLISILTLALTQMDKLVLSALLPLSVFGAYSFATTVANTIGMLSGPIHVALSPRFAQLAARGAEEELRVVYHQASQGITVLMGSAAVVLIVFMDEVLLAWTANPLLVEQVSTVARIQTVGVALNLFLWTPYQLQLAYGWTRLTITVCSVATVILLPTMLVLVPRYGAISAVWIWVVLNLGQMLVTVTLMHRRLLRGEQLRWYTKDILLPTSAAVACALLLRQLPSPDARMLQVAHVVFVSTFVLLASLWAAPETRKELFALVRRSAKALKQLRGEVWK